MLSAAHENASTWYLYVGDRGVIDSLLNKTMLSSPAANRMLVGYFRLAHVLQLLAMTYVAAQKGIDGVSLVLLLLVNYGFQYLFEGHGPTMASSRTRVHGRTYLQIQRSYCNDRCHSHDQ